MALTKVQSEMSNATAPAFSSYLSSSQTIPSNSEVIIQFDGEEFDTASRFNASGSTVGGIPAYSFMPNVAGYYQINGTMTAGTSFSGGFVKIWKNGASYKLGGSNNISTTNNAWSVSCLVYLNGSTDYIQLYGLITIGQPLYNSSIGTYFNGALVRPA